MYRPYNIILFWLINVVLGVSYSALAQENPTGVTDAPTGVIDHEALPYVAIDGKVDRATYVGWKIFHSACYICHGVDAVGTSVAPDLTERLSTMSARDFAVAVLYRYPIITGLDDIPSGDLTSLREAFTKEISKAERGEILMPSWEYDAEVRPHVLHIYGYLRARADGALGPGEPGIITVE